MIKTLYDDRFLVLQVLVIIDAKPKDLGLPTEAYVAVEEVHDVSIIYLMINLSLFTALEIQIFSQRQKTAVVNPSFSVSRRQ